MNLDFSISINIIRSALLGILQGITEFLPVSSSGHLALAERLFGGEIKTSLIFEITVHLGSLVAVFLVFWNQIVEKIRYLFRDFLTIVGTDGWQAGLWIHPVGRFLSLIVIATLPTVLIGGLFQAELKSLFSKPVVIGIMLMITGLVLFLSDLRHTKGALVSEMKIGTALAIGIVQGLAIIPGISRSGSTISVGVLLGLDRAFAASFSFILAIPAIIGAAILEFSALSHNDILPFWELFAGFTAATISSYIALRVLIRMVLQARLKYFSYYCWAAGISAIIYFGIL